MNRSKLALAALAMSLPVLAFAAPASAASAHNSQTGANTSNPYDGPNGHTKKMMMKKHMKRMNHM